MNERVQALRELSVTTQPHIDMERAKVKLQPTRNMKVSCLCQSFVHRFYMTILQQRHFTSEMES